MQAPVQHYKNIPAQFHIVRVNWSRLRILDRWGRYWGCNVASTCMSIISALHTRALAKSIQGPPKLTSSATFFKAKLVMVVSPPWYGKSEISFTMALVSWNLSRPKCILTFLLLLNCKRPTWVLSLPMWTEVTREMRNFRTFSKFLGPMLAEPSTTRNRSFGCCTQLTAKGSGNYQK